MTKKELEKEVAELRKMLTELQQQVIALSLRQPVQPLLPINPLPISEPIYPTYPTQPWSPSYPYTPYIGDPSRSTITCTSNSMSSVN